MVRNPGLIPGLESIRAGDIGARRKNMYEMMVGLYNSLFLVLICSWFSCINPSEVTEEPFLADAIIANPPSYAHIHCAEKLGIPLHLMFTMPWSPTHEFPHPLATISSTNLEPNTTVPQSKSLLILESPHISNGRSLDLARTRRCCQ